MTKEKSIEQFLTLLTINALSTEEDKGDTVHGYTEWLEKIIVESETFERLCEDTTDKEWCEKNCNYSSIQAECLRHLYEVSKGEPETEPAPVVAYICDRRRCAICSGPDGGCDHTTDIKHAAHFKNVAGQYFERPYMEEEEDDE